MTIQSTVTCDACHEEIVGSGIVLTDFALTPQPNEPAQLGRAYHFHKVACLVAFLSKAAQEARESAKVGKKKGRGK